MLMVFHHSDICDRFKCMFICLFIFIDTGTGTVETRLIVMAWSSDLSIIIKAMTLSPDQSPSHIPGSPLLSIFSCVIHIQVRT